MLDTNVFDKIVATPGLTTRICRLVESGALTILTTHIQEDELAAIPPSRRDRIARVPRVRVPTSELVWDVSRWDQARFGTGEPLEQIRGIKTHTKDGLIGATASAECAVLVTEEGRLTRRATKAGVEVWNFTRFAEWAGSH